MADETNTSVLLPIDIRREMRKSVSRLRDERDYRAARCPYVRDGLKPVQRRHLGGHDDLGLAPIAAIASAPKFAATLPATHPHGEAVIYPAMVRLAQTSTCAIPGRRQGNFGFR